MILFFVDPEGILIPSHETEPNEPYSAARRMLLESIHDLEAKGFEVGIVITSIYRSNQSVVKLRELYSQFPSISKYIVDKIDDARDVLRASHKVDLHRGALIKKYLAKKSSNSECYFILDQVIEPYSINKRTILPAVVTHKIILQGDRKLAEQFTDRLIATSLFDQKAADRIKTIIKENNIQPEVKKIESPVKILNKGANPLFTNAKVQIKQQVSLSPKSLNHVVLVSAEETKAEKEEEEKFRKLIMGEKKVVDNWEDPEIEIQATTFFKPVKFSNKEDNSKKPAKSDHKKEKKKHKEKLVPFKMRK